MIRNGAQYFYQQKADFIVGLCPTSGFATAYLRKKRYLLCDIISDHGGL